MGVDGAGGTESDAGGLPRPKNGSRKRDEYLDVWETEVTLLGDDASTRALRPRLGMEVNLSLKAMGGRLFTAVGVLEGGGEGS